MSKKLFGFLIVVTLVSQSAFAQIEERVKGRVRWIISQKGSDQVSHQDVFSQALNLYPELNNEKDRLDLENFIAEFIAELNSARTLTGADQTSVDGNWKFVHENAVLSIRGNSGTMSTSYNGCTEVTPLSLKYSSAGRFELVESGPMTQTPSGCSGGSAPFPTDITLDYKREGNFLTLIRNTSLGANEYYALLQDHATDSSVSPSLF